ncbi:hypothetical protein [Legionella sp. km772]|uniref:hypothetical protein n=1 Tax=Legionella sp. km772 TaxID=2498111 RepID=UPI000F8C4A34|nr:hypothetical protein [Legionella sp. km772]RUR05045.1 hypothetical protein ELY15_14795 [Legionella sp. km772]
MTQDELNLQDMTFKVFHNKEAAEQAFEAALKLGYKPQEINVVMAEDSKKKYYSTQSQGEEDAAKSLAVGGVVGGTIGSTIGALIALGTNIALPGLGLVMVGPLAGAGGVSGGLLGSLLGWGMPDNPPNPSAEKLKKGEILLIVHENKNRGSLKEAWKEL